MVTDASLDRLGHHLGAGAIDGRRFRMLINLAGDVAHEEDTWIGRRVGLGDDDPAGDRCDPALRDDDPRPGHAASATTTRSGRSRSTAASPGPTART